MATVITNLLSAIPFFGQDLVELIWGGLNPDEPQYGDVLLKILLNAGISPIFGFAYDLFIIIIGVKIAITRGKSAGVRSIHTSEASQRLHAGDLTYAYLVGLFEGKGYFTITKKGKDFIYELGIALSIRDVQLIYKIKNILGVGSVSFRQINELEMVSLKIRDKNHLKNYIFHIFDKYPMFSNKQYNFLWFKEAVLSDFIYSENLPKFIISNEPVNSINSIIKSSYFSAWLVGYIEAEGCFSTYKLYNESLITSFDISQRDGDILILAIREYLSITTKTYLDKTNCSKLKVTSVRSVENIIKYLQTAPVKLLGKKKLEYLLWLKQLRKISRYSDKIKIPLNY